MTHLHCRNNHGIVVNLNFVAVTVCLLHGTADLELDSLVVEASSISQKDSSLPTIDQYGFFFIGSNIHFDIFAH